MTGEPGAGRVESRREDGLISIVIAWVNSFELLVPVLDALQGQETAADEIIVATRHDVATQERLRRAYQEVTLLAAPARTTIPTLRSMGLKSARGAIVAVTEDHCVPSNDWVATIARRVRAGCVVVGGPVENAWTERLRDWAAFLADYAAFIGPANDGPVRQLPSNNVAYRREVVPGLCATLDRGLWESFYYDQLAVRGVSLMCAPEMLVHHRRPFDFWYFVAQRYHYSRSFAGMRCQFLTRLGQLKHALGSVLLPPWLLMRGLRILAAKHRLVGRYLCCLPLITMYVSAGAVGEMVGYIAGGGLSLEKVE